jgi:thymidylate kinase
VASNIAHQAARIADFGLPTRRVSESSRTPSLTRRVNPQSAISDLIEQIEHGVFGLPRADLTILLDIPADSASELIARKKPRDYTDHAADLHEADTAYLASVRQMYLKLAAGRPDWRVIPVVSSGAVRPIAEIGDDIFAACGLADADGA